MSDIVKPLLQRKRRITLGLVMLFCILCFNNSYSQDKDKIKDGIYKVYELFTSGDLTGIEKYIDPSYIEHTPAPGTRAGLDGLKDVMANFKKSFPDIKFTVNDIIFADNRAAVLGTITGTNTGEFMGMPATNKKITVMGIDWLVFNKDSKCTEHWGYQDDMGMMQQLGLMK